MKISCPKYTTIINKDKNKKNSRTQNIYASDESRLHLNPGVTKKIPLTLTNTELPDTYDGVLFPYLTEFY